MGTPTVEEMAGKLLAERFEHTGPAASTLSDPIADTPMVVTLDQLRPYDHNPRLTRNPLHDEIKASIRERGLDQPPAITRRPGETHFVIRNGGNTRLAVLRELWTETKNEKFFRVLCIFRPWSTRGEILALTGHLAENELHGRLSFIERALGVEKARELYEREDDRTLSQSELARRLSADGYPIQQSHISRMRDAVSFLLPAIPRVLYGGLGRHQVDRLAVLRRAGERLWQQHSDGASADDAYRDLFHDVLATFDGGSVDDFAVQRVQDELLGRMAEQFSLDYDALSLALTEQEQRQRALSSDPTTPARPRGDIPPAPGESSNPPANLAPGADRHAPVTSNPDVPAPQPPLDTETSSHRTETANRVSEAGTRLPDDPLLLRTDDGTEATSTTGKPSITPAPDPLESLRTDIARLARVVASDIGQANQIESTADDLGFVCYPLPQCAGVHTASLKSRALPALLRALCVVPPANVPQAAAVEDVRLVDVVGPLLVGNPSTPGERLSDGSLDALFQLLRLARQLRDLDHRAEYSTHDHSA